ncbi:Shedu anti-phage system protein SduA domain-containing protein [Streptosporangium sp. NPDC006930]|uniref:Shedu anti-phage system protein SduA domain-containing protein n=1 Tax=Streptosporangium sp. NPDC006930 TaxID=3154783 RepID=UPI00342FFFD6
MRIPGPPDGAPSVHWPHWRRSHIDELRNDPQIEHFVWWWEDIDTAETENYLSTIDAASNERPIQAFLNNYPRMLVQHLQGAHGRWAIPQSRLGSEFIPDFLIGEAHSYARQWILVELQSPQTKLFTKKRRPSEQLDEGISQVLEWRRWLARNRDYANRHTAENGLGLLGINDRSKGLILIGRAADRSLQDRDQLEQLCWDMHLDIRSYDWLYRVALHRITIRAEMLESARRIEAGEQSAGGRQWIVDDEALDWSV